MTVTLALAITIGIVVTAGCYLCLSRDFLRIVVGIVLLSAAANLTLLAVGRITSNQPAVIPAGEVVLAGANPLPQALVLTAIVIGFMLACFALILAVRLGQASGTDDVDELDAAEPRTSDPHMPPLEATEATAAGSPSASQEPA